KQDLAANGGTPPYSWSISGSLPGGLVLNGFTIQGTPTTVSTSNFVVRVSDSGTPPQTAQKNLSIRVDPPPLQITTTTLPPATVNVPYSQTLGVANGTPPYTWSRISGNLPAGLSLNPQTGAITGTPMTATTANFTVSVA